MADSDLTRRERDVLALAIRGLTNKAIAGELGISENAVRYHLKELHSKLGTGSDRAKLTRWDRIRGAWPGLGLLSGAGPKILVGGMMSAIAVAGVAAAVTHSGGDQAGHEGVPAIVDGKYPNGCPTSYTAWEGATREDFGHVGGSLEAIVRLNPGLPAGPIPAGTEVHVPYNPKGTCYELTEANRTPSAGGTPGAR
jgi:DNA-binding CsgD family transcriptional regulator